MNQNRLFFWSAHLVVLFTALLRGQTPDTATVRGHVVDQSDAAVSDVQISLKNRSTGLERKTQTDASGNFSLGGLPIAGIYDLSASKKGFAESDLKEIALMGGIMAEMNIRLNAGGGQTQITVTGIVGGVRADEPQLGERLGLLETQKTPLLNRRITYLPLLNAANRPAINQGDVFMNQNLFTTNGSGRRQTWFEVDGSTGNDSWGRQTIFTNVPLAAVQEMTVLESAFSAEYGGSTGSVVNIVTRSGGNNWHGEILGLWRPSDSEAALSGFNASNATSGNDLTNDTLRQTALSLLGPIGRSRRTQFFLAGGIQLSGPCLACYFAHSSRQFHRPLSRLTGFLSPGSSHKRQQQSIRAQQS